MLQWFLKILRGKSYERAEREQQLVNALPSDVARQRALSMLRNPALYLSRPALVGTNVRGLGPTLSEFFSLFSSVEDANGGTRIGAAYVGTSSMRPKLIRIGEDVEMHFELVVHPGEDKLYWISDADHKLGSGYSTIYHLIVSDHDSSGRDQLASS